MVLRILEQGRFFDSSLQYTHIKMFHYFILTLSPTGGQNLEVVEKCKLLGLIVRSDLKWHDNTVHMCKKGYTRMWMVRRLKKLGANIEELLDVYTKQIR